MRLTFTLLTFLLVSTFGLAQNVKFNDTFDDDKNTWSSNSDGFVTSVNKGKLTLENNHEKNSKWVWKAIVDDGTATDFDVEATLILDKTPNEYATYGLVWGMYSDNSDYRVVQLSANKQLQIYHYYGSDFHYDKKWEPSKQVNGKDKKNKVKVEKRANIYKVFINDELVFQTGNNSYYGGRFGFIVDAGVTLLAEDFKVIEYPSSINVVKEFNSNLKMLKLPETVSSPTIEETNPVISADGNILYFDRKNNPSNVETDKDDIWYSVKDRNGKWEQAKNIGRPLNNKDYSGLESEDKFKFIEYYKWRFNAEYFTPVGGKFVLRTSMKLGWLGYYNSEIGLPPFERFQLGGDGLSGGYTNTFVGTDVIALRGYEIFNTPGTSSARTEAIFNKYTVELRYPIVSSQTANIYALAFAEGGNLYPDIDAFNPFELKRSAGLGVRAWLPMFGLLGVDYGIRFDDQIPGDLQEADGFFDYITKNGKFTVILGFEPE